MKRLKAVGINASCFIESDKAKTGKTVLNLSVVSIDGFRQIVDNQREKFIVIVTLFDVLSYKDIKRNILFGLQGCLTEENIYFLHNSDLGINYLILGCTHHSRHI